MGNLYTGKFGWEEPAAVPGSAFGPEWSVWVREASGSLCDGEAAGAAAGAWSLWSYCSSWDLLGVLKEAEQGTYSPQDLPGAVVQKGSFVL